MYTNFFGFNVKPFELTPDSNFLYLSADLREILATLEYGISQRRGFGLLVGGPGTGKTTLINSLIDKSGIDANFAYIFNPDLNFNDLLHTVLVEFDLACVEEDLSKTKAMHRLNTFVIEQFEKDRNTVIIVDEAQYLDIKTLENLRLLSNFETRKDKLIHIIISGQPELENTLSQKSLSQLAQRIGLRCRTKPLAEKEAYEYIEHRLKVAGYNGPQLFANKAKQIIWTYSKGIPRTINIICDNCLLTGYATNKDRIDSAVVQEVIEDINKVPLNNFDSFPDKSKDSAEGMNNASLEKSDRIFETEPKFSAKLEQKDEDSTDVVHKIRKTLMHKEEPELAGQKARRFSTAWIAGIAGGVIIINIFILYFLFGSFKDLNNEISSKLEAMRDNIQYQLGTMKEDMNNVTIRANQQMRKKLESEVDFKQSETGPNSDEKQSIDTSSSVSRLDNDNFSVDKSFAASGLNVEGVIENNSVAVRKGDTLNEIIIRIYGERNPKILDAILKINPEIKNPDLIFENQIIKLPEKINLGYIDLLEPQKSFQQF
jgi:type II secretory pathway predicted ATPase ExeA